MERMNSVAVTKGNGLFNTASLVATKAHSSIKQGFKVLGFIELFAPGARKRRYILTQHSL